MKKYVFRTNAMCDCSYETAHVQSRTSEPISQKSFPHIVDTRLICADFKITAH